MSTPEIVPDTKDWTFVIAEGCTECGFVPGDPAATGAFLRGTVPQWQAVLARPDAGERPRPDVWSALEYGCHVRDVCRVFRRRLDLMLTEDDPRFPNWDQDRAALDDDYTEQEPGVVSAEYADQAGRLADAFDAVQPGQWGRRGLRSNGSQFTVATLAVYFAHDIAHHLHDVGAER